MDLFDAMNAQDPNRPLAEQLRPIQFEEFVDTHITYGKALYQKIKVAGLGSSLIIWGPPGSGKTTLAKLLISKHQGPSRTVNAVSTGAKALKELTDAAETHRKQFNENTLLFIDEIHRLNKAQQDVLLPSMESGATLLIGATTENPSYELNSAVLSRSQVIKFEPLTKDQLRDLAGRAFVSKQQKMEKWLTEEAVQRLISISQGDARRLLGAVSEVMDLPENCYGVDALEELFSAGGLPYDKSSDQHYDTISAFIKSLRNSDADAGLYYLARMIKAGEDPKFIARRMVIFASEDVGNADPNALTIALNGFRAVEVVGLPEAGINLAQVVTYLSSVPKSNRSYQGFNKAMASVDKYGALPVPMSLRSAKTKLSDSIGYGKDYKYSHDSSRGYVQQQMLPDAIKDHVFYEPTKRGFENRIREFKDWIRQPQSDES